MVIARSSAMHRATFKLITSMVILTFAAQFVFAQSLGESEKNARDVVEQFCKMDWEGKLLTSEGDEATAKLLITPHRSHQDQEIDVVDSYVVLGPNMQGRNAHFNVDYRLWGQIDSSLRFAREEGEIPNKPIKDRESYDLVFTNRYNDFGEGGPKAVVRGPLTWRIGITPSRPRVGVDAAIRYVAEMRDHANDPVIKENADKTIAALKRVAVAKSEQRSPNLRQAPVEVVKQFIRMELDGKQLSPNGWEEMSTLFVQPGPLPLDTIDVMKEIAVGSASIRDENRAEVSTGSFRWGQLNSKTALFEPDAMPGEKVLGNYVLVLTDKQGKLAPDTGQARQVNGSLEWKISGPLRQPQISVDTAIHYVTDMRDKTTDPVTKKNANETLAKLKTLR
jgi:hypothetical protein